MRFVKALSVAVLLSCLSSNLVLAGEAAKKPNNLFILIEDMGYGDLSCYGGTRVQTPMIDGLAKEGVRFTQFYVNSPICSPSRTAFTTGQYPGRWAITSYLDNRELDHKRGVADWLDPKAPSLARYFLNAGYYTAHVGKWHMGGQRDVDDAPLIQEYGFITSVTNFEGPGERVLPLFEPHADGSPFHHYPTSSSAEQGGSIHWVKRHKVTEYYVDRAIKEIEAAAKANKPFYINLWLDDVHTPLQAPPKLRRDGSKTGNYLGVMDEMDRQLGRVFEYVRSKPALRDNLLILVSSDNGPEDGCGLTGGLRGGKCRLYEGGNRSPLIVWGPSIVPSSAVGTTNDKTVLAAMDFAPSLTALAKVPVPADVHFDGLNMADALVGRTSPKREQDIMWVRPPDRPGPHHIWPDLAIRDGDMKLLVNRDGSKPELFNLVDDPKEEHNLADKNPDLVRRLSEKVIQWDRDTQRPPHVHSK